MKSLAKIVIATILVIYLIWALVGPLAACDTWVALKGATLKGISLFAKNSDRTVSDCQPLMFYPRQKWPAGSEIDIGRITIPQVNETFATLGSSPYWCWGYEEGINEFGVAIGNEGVFTKPLLEGILAAQAGQGPEPGPTGMDLVRRGLERGRSAREAMQVIAGLVEKCGQFGAGMPGQGLSGAYDNSYLIADAKEAWVLETAGKRWAAKRVGEGVASISNTLGLTTAWDLASPDLAKFAEQKGWWSQKPGAVFDFARAYLADTPELQNQRRRALTRAGCSLGLLKEKSGKIDEPWMMRIARDRSTSPGLDLDVTASSCVAVLPDSADELPVFWWAPSVPSAGCYIPFFVHGSRLPEIVSAAGTFGKKITPPEQVQTDAFSADSLWWLFRDLADKVSQDWKVRNAVVRSEFDALEREFASGVPDVVKKAAELRRAGKTEEAAKVLDEFSAACVDKAVAKVNELRKRFEPEVAAPQLKKTGLTPDRQMESLAGVYVANFGPYNEADFTIAMKDGRLFLGIPGRNDLELKPPDSSGAWKLAVSDQAGVSFILGADNTVIAMKFFQGSLTFELPRKGVVLAPEIPLDRLRKYLGSYYGEKLKETLEMVIKNNCLALKIPGQKTYELRPPDKEGKWFFRVSPVAAVSFKQTESGDIESFTYFQDGGELLYKKIGGGPDRKEPALEDVFALRRLGVQKAALEKLGLSK